MPGENLHFHFGEGLRIKGLQLKVIVDTTDAPKANKIIDELDGDVSPLKIYGEDTAYVAVTTETSLDIKLEQHIPVPTNHEIEVYKAVEELYAVYDPLEGQTKNAFFQFHVENQDGEDFYFNTGSIRSNYLPYLISDVWATIDTYQVWVDQNRDAEYEPSGKA